MMIAQLTPDMLHGMPTYLICTGALLWIFNMGANVVERFRGKRAEPPNEQLQLICQNMERRLQLVENSVSNSAALALESWQKHESHISQRAGKIYDEVNEQHSKLRAEIQSLGSGLHQEMKEQTTLRESQITALRETVNALPERLLTMMKNIKDLKET